MRTASLLALGLLATLSACGGSDSEGADPGASAGGSGGSSSAGKAGAGTSGKGGASAGSAGTKGGAAGTGGASGSSAGNAGSAGKGTGGSTAGSGGSAGKGTSGSSPGGSAGSGTGGTSAGAGGSSAGAAGTSAGAAGTSAGAAGTSAGAAGTSAGAAGSSAGAGGSTAGGGGSGGLVTPGDPGAHDVLFAIDGTKSHPISPYVYGTNQPDWAGKTKHLTAARVGGNRLTAYNWETNASNAGSDYLYQNDTYISASSVSGDPMQKATAEAHAAGASMVMTVPIAGWVAADTAGPCPSNPSPAQIAQRFFPILPEKGSAFAYPPDKTDGKVYADEFVHWLESQFPDAQSNPSHRIFYQLDNEPDLWSATHSEIHPSALTYAELVQKNVAFAKAIKGAAPSALVLGPVNYGYAGYVNLQNAPDAGGKDFLEHWLSQMAAAEQQAGKRLVDVLDVHWYPEATGDGHRIIDEGTTPGEVEARIQAPRSLWDPGYVETSWITQCCSNGPIQLIPWLKKKVDAKYPGTRISFTEYNYGGGAHISGGMAEADVLGVFGRDDVFLATLWEMAQNESFIYAGFAMYRNFDGNGGAFGDTSADVSNGDIAKTSVYASFDAADHGRVVVVCINKTGAPLTAGITVAQDASLGAADVYQLTSAGPAPQKVAGLTAVATNAFSYVMPPMSVSTLVLHP